MSLLMKALEKAAQQRDQTGKAPTAPLSLEPVQEPARSAQPSSERVSATPAPRATSPSPQLRAASVLAASARTDGASPLLAWFTARPVYAFGALAALFLACYGAYVYVQIAHPGLLTRSPPRVTPSQPPAQAAAPPAAVATAPTPAEREEPDDAPRAAPPVATPPTPPAPPATSATTTNDSGVIARPAPAATPPAQPAPPVRMAPAAIPLAQQQRLAISRADDAQPRVNPNVAQAWTALQAGELDTARRLYEQVLRTEPANVDAHLGLAAIAQGDGRLADAQQHYMTILDAEPRHALAQNGLIALSSRNNPQAAETRLKQLIAREPSAPLYFSLGNLYAEQGQWRDAQQAYFQAHALDGRNPDYAFNLAVGLEHLAQPRIALDFYRKAVELAAARGNANFDTARAQQRITRLSAANP